MFHTKCKFDYYLRVDLPFEVSARKELQEEQNEDVEINKEDETDESNYKNLRQTKLTPLERGRRYVMFGYNYKKKLPLNYELIDLESKTRNTNLNFMSMMNLSIREKIEEAVTVDKDLSEEQKKKLTKYNNLICLGITQSPEEFPHYEIETQHVHRKLYYRILYGDDMKGISMNLLSILALLYDRVSPLVIERDNQPIFVVEPNMSGQWYLTSYCPTAISKEMFDGVCCTVKSECGLEYDVSIVSKFHAGHIELEDDDTNAKDDTSSEASSDEDLLQEHKQDRSNEDLGDELQRILDNSTDAEKKELLDKITRTIGK